MGITSIFLIRFSSFFPPFCSDDFSLSFDRKLFLDRNSSLNFSQSVPHTLILFSSSSLDGDRVSNIEGNPRALSSDVSSLYHCILSFCFTYSLLVKVISFRI